MSQSRALAKVQVDPIAQLTDQFIADLLEILRAALAMPPSLRGTIYFVRGGIWAVDLGDGTHWHSKRKRDLTRRARKRGISLTDHRQLHLAR